jgi:SHS2 domain-containing protein
MRHPLPGAPPLYREIEHTADCGIVVEAEAPAALFEKAALALSAIMIRPAATEAREERNVGAEAGDWADLLHHWLAEVLVVLEMDAFVAAEVTVTEIEPTSVRGILRGEKFDATRHELCGEVKAVTYHELAVTRTHVGWQARVIFDV